MPIVATTVPAAGPNRDEMTTELLMSVQGYSLSPDSVAALRSSITSSSLTLTADGVASPGVVEIDDELIYITAVDPSTGACTVHPRGRGWKGSVAAAHSAGAVVTNTPTLPRAVAARMINDQIAALHPTLYGIASGSSQMSTDRRLELPTEAEFVLDVREKRGSEWVRVRAWEAEPEAPESSTRRSVIIPGVDSGVEVQVVWGLRPAPLAAGAARFSDTGLPLAAKEIVLLGALSRLSMMMDVGRLSDRFDTARGDAQQPQIGSGVQVARVLQGEYTRALQAESLALRMKYPARSHFTR